MKRRKQSSKGLYHLHLLCRRKRTWASGLLQRTGVKNARTKAQKGTRLSQRLSSNREISSLFPHRTGQNQQAVPKQSCTATREVARARPRWPLKIWAFFESWPISELSKSHIVLFTQCRNKTQFPFTWVSVIARHLWTQQWQCWPRSAAGLFTDPQREKHVWWADRHAWPSWSNPHWARKHKASGL